MIVANHNHHPSCVWPRLIMCFVTETDRTFSLVVIYFGSRIFEPFKDCAQNIKWLEVFLCFSALRRSWEGLFHLFSLSFVWIFSVIVTEQEKLICQILDEMARLCMFNRWFKKTVVAWYKMMYCTFWKCTITINGNCLYNLVFICANDNIFIQMNFAFLY